MRIFASLLLFYGGVSILYRPNYEVLYNTWTVDAGCHEALCLRLYILEIGNTGWSDQDAVSVDIQNHWLEHAQLPPKAAMFGKVPRKLGEEADGETMRWSLGKLESGKRIDIRFTLGIQQGHALPEWKDILLGVRPASGEAHFGHPEWTTFSRFLAAFL